MSLRISRWEPLLGQREDLQQLTATYLSQPAPVPASHVPRWVTMHFTLLFCVCEYAFLGRHYLFWVLNTKGILQYIIFWDLFFKANITLLCFICVTACSCILIFTMVQHVILWTFHNWSILLLKVSTEGHCHQFNAYRNPNLGYGEGGDRLDSEQTAQLWNSSAVRVLSGGTVQLWDGMAVGQLSSGTVSGGTVWLGGGPEGGPGGTAALHWRSALVLPSQLQLGKGSLHWKLIETELKLAV